MRNHSGHLETKEKLSTKVGPTGAHTQVRVGPEQMFLAYTHLRLMHFTCAVVFTSLLGPGFRSHFEQFKQRLETGSLAT